MNKSAFNINLKRSGHIFLYVLFLFFFNANAQNKTYKPSRILFLVDGSSSMTFDWKDNTPRFTVARELVLRIMDSIYAINNEVQFAVRAYGTESPSIDRNCNDTKLIIPFSYQNLHQINLRLKHLNTIGVSPIAHSLKEAAYNELRDDDQYDYSFILITDGGESCGGDVCAAYQKVLQQKVKVIPYIIGLDKNSNLEQYYNCLGKYVGVLENPDIEKAVRFIVNENRPLLEKPKTLNLTTTYSNLPQVPKDTVIKVIEPIIEPPLLTDNLSFLPTAVNKVFSNIILEPSKANTRKFVNMKMLEFEEELFTNEINKIYANNIIRLKDNTLNIKTAKNFYTYNGIKVPEFEYEAPAIGSIEKLHNLEIKSYNENYKVAIQPKARKYLKLNTNFDEYVSLETTDIAYLTSKLIKPQTDFTYNINSTKNKYAYNKLKLGEAYFEPVYEHTNIENISSIKILNISTSNLIPSISKVRKYNDVLLPKDFLEPEYVHVDLKSVFSLPVSQPFQYSFKPKIAIGILPKKSTLPKGVTIEKEDPISKADENTNNATIERTIADNTYLEIYFTNGKGKFYTNKPKVKLLEAGTEKVYKQTLRSVYKGQPEPIKIDKAGNYDIVIENPQGVDLIQRNFTIEANKTNKITFIVTEGTILFAYQGNYKRPVEYTATITRRFSSNNYIKEQKCTEKVVHEPGEYSVEINTTPPLYYSIQVYFGATTEIQISQPGSLQITNTKNIGKVDLFEQDGEGQYKIFKTINVTGNLEQQNLVLQPSARYIAKYLPPNAPLGTNPVQTIFKVQSNKQTDLFLDEPGYILFTNKKPVGNVTVSMVDGTQTVKIKTFTLTGNGVGQNLALQPGLYKVAYRTKGSTPSTPDAIKEIVISPAQQLSLDLE